MAEEPDYESLPPNAGLAVNMFAGAMAGISEHAVMFPVDSIKTRMQVFTTSPVAVYSGVGNAFARISSTEGMRALWRGVWSVVLGAGPAHAVHFGTLEAVKEMMGGNEAGNQWLATSVAGASATTAADALMNPFDVIKQRMQVHKSEFRSVLTCARTVYQNEGLAAFYVSYPTTLAISIPFNAIQVTIYEQIKRALNPSHKYSPSTHMIAGAGAGAVAAALTTPLDVAKTMLQTRGTSLDPEIRNVSGMREAFGIIWRKEGLKGFARGMTPRVITTMPSTALCWLSYEFFSSNAQKYFETLNNFVSGRISRAEFDDALKPILDGQNLIQLHNALVISLFDSRSHRRHVSPPSDLPKPPPRKRRRMLPYQGPEASEEELTLRSARMKRWTVSVGKQERERVRHMKEAPPVKEPPRPREDTDEIARERAVVLSKERDAPPGTHVGVPLASHTRSLTVQLIAERINLICAQSSLHTPNRAVPHLMHLACEVKLKQLVTHALTLTTDSLAISSITTSNEGSSTHHHPQKVLTTRAFETLCTLAPYDLPNKSATAMRLALGDREDEDDDRDVPLLKNREVKDQRWQIMALLGERSTVKEALRGVR
ncbi:Fe(2+) transporter [Marasmius crinis-equi]|uniref:Fe(2+) transporter n=1 Tax=Marasmius crinis-equi TaxID=585013 RepID=A0ABR3FUU2_9AGAR